MRDALVIFDVDGTLIDSGGIVVDTMSAAFEASGVSPPAAETVRSLIGVSLPGMVATLTDGLPDEVVGRIVAAYRQGFTDAIESGGEPELYPGAAEALDRLTAAGLPLGIATGKSKRGVDRLIASKGWGGRFATLQCADHHPSKPHPSMILRALSETATLEGRAVMVGDTTFDMEMASAAGVAGLGVGWGYHASHALDGAGAEAIWDDFDALASHLLERFA